MQRPLRLQQSPPPDDGPSVVLAHITYQLSAVALKLIRHCRGDASSAQFLQPDLDGWLSRFFCTPMDRILMVPQRTMCCSLHLASRMLIACLSVGLLSGAWLIAHNRDRGLAGSELAHQGTVCPAVAGPGQVQTQLADRLVGGGGSCVAVDREATWRRGCGRTCHFLLGGFAVRINCASCRYAHGPASVGADLECLSAGLNRA